MANIRAYAQMVDVAEEEGLPKHYATDLYTIDRAYMEWDHAPRVFGWVLRDSGTHLIMNREDRSTAEYWTKEPGHKAQCYWYDGHNLDRITPQELYDKTLMLSPFQPVGAAALAWVHNRIQLLKVQDAARRGRTIEHLDFAVPTPDRKPHAVGFETYQFRWISSLEHTSQHYGPRHDEARARMEKANAERA